MMLSRKRCVAAITLLMLMAANFAAEGYALFQSHRIVALAAQPASTTCKAPAEAPAPGSCCAGKKPKPKAKACGCPHCGDHCPMGDACTCNPSGAKSSAHADGLFFKRPGCHPEQEKIGTSYLPLSMRLVFVAPSPEVEPIAPTPLINSFGSQSGFTGCLPAPPVPPPRSAAA